MPSTSKHSHDADCAGENSLRHHRRHQQCRGPFGFARGRLFDFADRFALRIGWLRSR